MLLGILLLWLLAYLVSAVFQAYKPLPEGLSAASPLRHAEQLGFFADYTYMDAQGVRHKQQEIFDQVIGMITEAKRLIVMDMFLFNDYVGASKQQQRPLAEQVTQALIAQKRLYPDMTVVVITDPINTVYGGQFSPYLNQLRASGIEVVETNLLPLRASNPLWSGFWYICCQWTGNNPQGGWLPNALGADKVTLRSYLSLLNFKANHRKTLVTDSEQGWQALVTSANPHDASSWHDNVALKFTGQAALDVLETERAVARLSAQEIPVILTGASDTSARANEAQVQVLTEAKIRDALLHSINTAVKGDQLDIAVFYLSHRDIIQAIKQSHQRGVQVRLVLDPNEDAFGHKKNGIPNRQVARELQQAGVSIRWCDTHGEQCHSKMLIRRDAAGQSELILGSANYTRRNLDDLNLETNVRVLAKTDAPVMVQANGYFERVWGNQNGQRFTVDYAQYQDDSSLKYWWYRFSEWSGLSTF